MLALYRYPELGGIVLANIRSAAKRARQSEVRRLRNRWYKSRARTFVKQARQFLREANHSGAQEAVRRAARALDLAAQKGVIHPNNAARRKSRLMRQLNRLHTGAGSA